MATKGAAGAKKSNIRGQFINTQQTEAYRQLVTVQLFSFPIIYTFSQTENRILASKNKADLDRMKTHMEDKSNFFTMYQKPEVLTASKTQFHEHDKDTFYKVKSRKNTSRINMFQSLPFHRDTVNDYDPKTKKDRTYATHKAVQGPLAKELFSTPVTT